MIQWGSWLSLSFTVSGPKLFYSLQEVLHDYIAVTMTKKLRIKHTSFEMFVFWASLLVSRVGTFLPLWIWGLFAHTDLVNWQNPIFTILFETTLLKIEAWIFGMWLSWAQFCTSHRLTQHRRGLTPDLAWNDHRCLKNIAFLAVLYS